ncbi:MAG TPA: TonB-dependent receptor [Terriglobales bacterium]|nr:TonB-dependent receptor [Terriglobales bacterium]
MRSRLDYARWRWAIMAAALLFAAGLAAAQGGRGGVSGLITDASGSAIPAAQVTLTNTATGVARHTVTTSAGLYSFVAVDPGTYTLTASHAGFRTTSRGNLTVEVDQTAQVNLTLATGAVQQTVEVSAAPPLLQSSNATIGQLITAQEIQNVPLNTRDVYQLVQLSPGVTPVNGVLNDTEFNSRPGAEVSGYSINGGPQGSIAYMEDGSPLTIAENNPGGTIPSLTPPLDSVQEYRVETNNLSAAYQSAGSGVISLVSKSGTNALHGDLFGYLRPNKLAASVPFINVQPGQNITGNTPPAFHRYQWGASIGGPIRKDKTFFFADYEGTQQRTVDTYVGTVPTMAERQGDFSDLVDPTTGAMAPIYNPFAPDQSNGNRTPFASNNLSAHIDPVAAALVKYYPQPNRAGQGIYHTGNYFDQGTDPNDAEKFDVRLDDSFSQKQQIFGRFSFARLHFGNANHYHNLADPQQYQNITNDRNFLFGDDYSFSPTTIFEFRYSFVRHYENQTSDPAGLGFNMTSVGFPAALAAQQVFKDMPYIYINGPSLGSPAWTNFHFATQNHDFISAFDLIRGRHSIKLGAEYEEQYMNVGQPVAPSGFYIFDGTASSSSTWAGDGDPFADFMMGMGGAPGDEWQPAFSKDQFLAESNPYWAFYVQDQYQVNAKLTLNLGLRWDVFGGRNERYDRLEWFDPNVAYSVNGVALKGGEQFVRDHESPSTTNYGDFGPRLGLAYQPFQNVVIRGGFGLFYGPSSHMVSNSAIDSDSFAPNTLWNATTLNADGNSVMVNPLSNPFPSGVVQGTNGRLGPATNLGSALTTVLRSQPEPSSYNWNFGLQYELPAQWVVTAAYVANHGIHEISQTADLNQLPLSVFAKYDPATCGGCPSLTSAVPNPYVNAITDPNSPLYGTATMPLWESLEPFPQFTTGGVNAGVGIYSNPIESSIYNSLQLTVQKRMTKHFSMLASYTGGKLLGTGDGPFTFIGRVSGGHQDWRNVALDKSLSAQDVNRWMAIQTSYDLPIGPGRMINVNGWANELAGGWTLNTVLSLSTGTPVSVSGATNDPWFNQRPDLTCDPGTDMPKTSEQWFLPGCYAMPADPYLPGTGPRMLDHVRADGTSNLDLAIAKNFPLGEKRNLQFRVESFNLTNSVQLGAPNGYWNPKDLSTFGQVSGVVSTPRQFQFALRITY